MRTILKKITSLLLCVLLLSGCAAQPSSSEEASEPQEKIETAQEETGSKEVIFDIDEFYNTDFMRKYARQVIGQKLPSNLSFVDTANQKHVLEEFLGKNMIVEVMNTFCDSCTSVFPILEDTLKDYPEISLLSLAKDQSVKELQDYLEKHPETELTLYVNTDDTFEEGTFKVEYFPTLFFVDKNGIVKLVHVGNFDRDLLENLIYVAYRQ